MSYFRAVYDAQEISERALDLTEETIMINQGNYAAWQYRRKLLHELNKYLGAELIWLNEIAFEMEKNYQIWHHRRCIFEAWVRKDIIMPVEESKAEVDLKESLEKAKPVITAELQFLQEIFDSDSKNYHAWSHKIWLLERYELWADPIHLEFIEQMLDRDVENNSVWSFRYFIKMRTLDENTRKEKGTGLGPAFVEEEYNYVLENRLSHSYFNEAAWAYLRGLIANTPEEATQSQYTTARRIFIGDLPNMKAKIVEMAKFAMQLKFSIETMVDYNKDKD